MLKPDFFETGRRQQLTRQLITARVPVIAASPTRIRRALLRNVYTVLRLQPWRQANVYTVTRSPTRIVVVGGST